MAKRQGSMEINQTVMLQNALGFAQLSLMKSFDGSVSIVQYRVCRVCVCAMGAVGWRSTWSLTCRRHHRRVCRQFSEGAIVNAVGLLGARSTSILWTCDHTNNLRPARASCRHHA
eukprot:COSAG01_NODE_14591_length_1435_cov_1.172904_2_plen_115_part_00